MNKIELKACIQGVKQKIEDIKKEYNLNHDVTIVAATKTKSLEIINMLPDCGIDIMGENRVQEFIEKYPYLDKRLEKHFIGQLQTNKVKYIIDKVSLIHSLDRESLAQELQKHASRLGININVLIEVNMGEENKGGVPFNNVLDFYKTVQKNYPNIRIKGIMSVMPIGASENLYLQISKLYDILRIQSDDIKYLSLGMSEDYLTAIKYGANMIRLGRAILGERT
ncbi:MAG TPA: YggS family pyridoxal phosphate-dependent enzyme [Clostridia bacterium]